MTTAQQGLLCVVCGRLPLVDRIRRRGTPPRIHTEHLTDEREAELSCRRKVVERLLGCSRREFIALCSCGTLVNVSGLAEATAAETLATKSTTEWFETVFGELDQADQVLVREGRRDPWVRQTIRAEGNRWLRAVQIAPAARGAGAAHRRLCRARAKSLILDVGQEAGQELVVEGKKTSLRRLALDCVHLYRSIGDDAGFGGACLNLGQIERLEGHDEPAAAIYHEAVLALRAARRQRPHDLDVLTRLLYALLYDLHYNWEERRFQEARGLAEEIGDAVAWGIFSREQVGLSLARPKPQLDRAREATHEVRAFREKFGDGIPSCITASHVRTEVEFHWAAKERDAAVALLEAQLLPRYRNERHWSLTTKRLYDLIGELGLSPDLWVNPQFVATTIMEMPRVGGRVAVRQQNTKRGGLVSLC